jgi:hypothetical protein
MKIANDLFLWCISNFLDKLNENKLADKLRKKISTELDIKPKYAKEFDMYKALKFYLKSNEKLQSYLEKLTEKLVGEESEKEEEEEIKNDKKRKKSVNSNHNGKVDLLKKKRKMSCDSTDKLSHDKDFKVKSKTKVKEEIDEEETKKDSKPKNKTDLKANGKKDTKNISNDDESDFDIDPAKMREKYGIKVDQSVLNKPNTPFKRIKEEDYQISDNNLTNNSWDYYAKQTGNTFGNEANNRLKHTAGKDFKKEKTKFKNKSGFGGGQLTTEVKSIKLNYDTEDD